MKILVTGVNGFMGTNFARMASKEHKIYGIVLPGTPTSNCEPFVKRLYPVDIRDRGAVLDVFDHVKPDAVLHLAAKVGDFGKARAFLDVNVIGLENCLDGAMAAGTGRFVSISSLAVHGAGPFRNATENTPLSADRPNYAVSKIMGEHLVREYGKTGMQSVIVRPGLVPFGPGDLLFTLPFVKLIQRGIVPMVNGGRAMINTAFVTNLAHGLLLAITHPDAAGRTLIIADPPIRFREFVNMFSTAMKRRPIKIPLFSGPLAIAGRVLDHMPLPFAPPITEYRARVVARDFWFSTKTAEGLVNYKPLVTMQDAVQRSIEWARSI